MGRAIRVTVGPLVSASATKIALLQSPGAAGALVLNGAAGSFTANNIALSQVVTGAAAIVLNGILSHGSPATGYPQGNPIYITSAGNDSGITFAIVGLDKNGAVVSETLTGTNTGVVGSTNSYYALKSITTSNSTSGSGITVGTFGAATLDVARRVIITSGGNDTGVTFTIKGTNWQGDSISENVTGASGAAASSVLDYLTVTQVKASAAVATNVEVGTNGVAASAWVPFDSYYLPQVDIQCTASGTVNYTVQITRDSPNSPTNSTAAASMTWNSSPDPNAVGATGTVMSSLSFAPGWARILLNSGTGSVAGTFTQLGFRP
jgi:hypothetical protein